MAAVVAAADAIGAVVRVPIGRSRNTGAPDAHRDGDEEERAA
jgi:hypothetical protein